MKLVREHINEKFEENSDPIKDLSLGKEGMFRELEKRGVRMWFGWGNENGRNEGIRNKQEVIENIVEITKLVDKLVEAGFNPKMMSISHSDALEVKTIMVIEGNSVIFHCATEEDAKMIINIAKAFSIWTYDQFRIGKGEKYVYVDPEKHKWLDNLIENREKYRNVIT